MGSCWPLAKEKSLHWVSQLLFGNISGENSGGSENGRCVSKHSGDILSDVVCDRLRLRKLVALGTKGSCALVDRFPTVNNHIDIISKATTSLQEANPDTAALNLVNPIYR